MMVSGEGELVCFGGFSGNCERLEGRFEILILTRLYSGLDVAYFEGGKFLVVFVGEGRNDGGRWGRWGKGAALVGGGDAMKQTRK